MYRFFLVGEAAGGFHGKAQCGKGLGGFGFSLFTFYGWRFCCAERLTQNLKRHDDTVVGGKNGVYDYV